MHRSAKIIIGIILFLVTAYGIRSVYYNSHFVSDTVIDNVHIGGKTPTEAVQLIQDHLSNKRYKVIENHKQITTFTSKQAGVHSPTKSELSQIMIRQNSLAWPLHLIMTDTNTHNLNINNPNKKSLNHVAQHIIKTANQTKRTTSKNSQIAYRNGRFIITRPIYGTTVTLANTIMALKQVLKSNIPQLQLRNSYVKPIITTKNTSIRHAKIAAQKIIDHTLIFNIAGKKIKISTNILANWITTSKGELILKPKLITQYLTALSKKYSTVTKTRHFKTTNSGTVNVPAGLYGWSIQIAATIKRLKPLILNNMQSQNITLTPIIQGTGYHKNGSDIGKTYVEVSKVKQHMWIYKNGHLIISTAVVTGKPPKGTTPSGVYCVWNKQRNATLRGLNDDGSKYASKVSYWMPVDNTGVGIHDSPWQPQYGGTWYKSHGSHGCVNTPPSVMKKVFATVKLNTPVIIY